MTSAIIITVCVLLLIGYVFDLTSLRTRIPSVIIFLLLGWIVKMLSQFFRIQIPDISLILPVFGTIGLILIVLEGSLEIKWHKSKLGIIRKSFTGAFLSMLFLSLLLAFIFHRYGNCSFKDCMASAIPLSVISGAVAIPSAKNLISRNKEFVIYESSMSEIIGVLFFNYLILNESLNLVSFVRFNLQLISIFLISLIAIISLSLLLYKIEHHVKFIPIIILVILIYTVSEVYHLPALIFILLFGLFLNNLDELKRFKEFEKFRLDEMGKEVIKFRELTFEISFLVRALFFLLFGYLIDLQELVNTENLLWSFGIVISIYLIRVVQLKLSRLPFKPLLFIAPRGLITILLLLSLESSDKVSIITDSVVIQVIILTALIMMMGLIVTKTSTGPEKKNPYSLSGSEVSDSGKKT